MSRKQSREVAFKLLFALAFDPVIETELDLACHSEEQNDESISNVKNTIDNKELQYINKLCTAVKTNLAVIDNIISATAKGFSFDRIYRVDLTALRLAVGEIMYLPETPEIVAVNEAVNIVKKYGTAASAGYVNGILASVLQNKAGYCQEKQNDGTAISNGLLTEENK